VSAENAVSPQDLEDGFVPEPITASLDPEPSHATPVKMPDAPVEIPRDANAPRQRPRAVARDVGEAAGTGETAAGLPSNPLSTREAEAESFVPFVPPIRTHAEDLVVPLPQGTVAHDKARSLLTRFEARAAELNQAYREDRQLAESERIDARQLATKLDWYAMRWRNLGDELLNTSEARIPELIGFRGTLLAVVSQQWSFLASYATALRAGDKEAIDKALNEESRAEETLERARLYLR